MLLKVVSFSLSLYSIVITFLFIKTLISLYEQFYCYLDCSGFNNYGLFLQSPLPMFSENVVSVKTAWTGAMSGRSRLYADSMYCVSRPVLPEGLCHCSWITYPVIDTGSMGGLSPIGTEKFKDKLDM